MQHVVEVVRADQGPVVVADQVALGVVAHADRRQRARPVGVEGQQLVRRVVRARLGGGRAAVGVLGGTLGRVMRLSKSVDLSRFA